MSASTDLLNLDGRHARTINWTLRTFIVTVILLLILYFHWGTTTAAYLFGNISQIAALIIATVHLYLLQHSLPRQDPQRKAWSLATAGIFIWIFAQILDWYCEVVLDQIPYATVSDIFWVMGHGMLLVSFLMLVRHTPLTNLKLRIVFAAVFILVYGFIFFGILLPQLRSPEQSIAVKFLDFTYPSSDLFFTLLFCFLIPQSRFGKGPILFAVAFAILTYADLVLGISTDLNSWQYLYLDIAYVSAYFLIALAARASRQLRL